MLPLADALDQMNNRDRHGNLLPFNVSVVTYDRNKKTGGKIIEYKNVLLANAKPPKSRTAKAQQYAINSGKSPNHYRNKTRNLILKNGEKRKIHIRLILNFNGHTVV